MRTVLLPLELDHQVPVLRHPARMKVVACGRRWGKTALGLMAVIDGHGPILPTERPLYMGAWDGGKIWWVVPDYPTAQEIWRDLLHATRMGRLTKNEVERRIDFHSGGSVTVKSAHDPEVLVAVGLDGVVVDEAAKLDSRAWDFLRPTLADRQGWCIFISTPKGYNWFFDRFEYAKDAPGWFRWQEPTSRNPLITPDELFAARRDAPRFFGQEYEARFEAPEGAEWPPEYFVDIFFDHWPDGGFVATALALDPSKGKDVHKYKEGREPDYSAYCWGGVDQAGTVWIDADLDNVRDITRMVQDGIGHYRQFQPMAFVIEVNVFQELLAGEFIRMAKEANQPLTLPLWGITNTESKETRIRTIGPHLAKRELRFRDTRGCRLLVQQLRDWPAGSYDDGPDALAMLLRMLRYLISGHQEGAGQPKLLRA